MIIFNFLAISWTAFLFAFLIPYCCTICSLYRTRTACRTTTRTTTHIVGGRTFECSTTHVKRSFNRAINAIFWRNWQTSTRGGNPWAGKKMYAMFVVWTRMLYFAKKFFEIVRLCCRTILMKLFKTVNNEIIRECCSYFKFALPSELLDNLRVKFQNNFMPCTALFWH